MNKEPHSNNYCDDHNNNLKNKKHSCFFFYDPILILRNLASIILVYINLFNLSTRKSFGSITRQLSNHFDTLKVEIPCRHYFKFYDVLVFVFFSSPLMGNRKRSIWNVELYYILCSCNSSMTYKKRPKLKMNSFTPSEAARSMCFHETI